ncbi:MAG TPA: hypothetical protein VNW52_04255 [Burkholderiaceae bacterium]|jgi:hypothetical protein|nr:hypothetical protein [Burkholderiaceae bacterium]
MLYIIKRVTKLDPGADGGPLCISFESYFGKKYTLLFPRQLQASAHNLPFIGVADAAFHAPTLEIYSPVKRKAPENGEIRTEWLKDSNLISWRDARRILRKLKRHMIGLDADQHAVYETMFHATQNDGRA